MPMPFSDPIVHQLFGNSKRNKYEYKNILLAMFWKLHLVTLKVKHRFLRLHIFYGENCFFRFLHHSGNYFIWTHPSFLVYSLYCSISLWKFKSWQPKKLSYLIFLIPEWHSTSFNQSLINIKPTSIYDSENKWMFLAALCTTLLRVLEL